MDTPSKLTSGKTPVNPTTGETRAKESVMQSIVLVLSLLLIVYISYDTFKNIPFLDNPTYMTFQFFVCVVFLCDFFFELRHAPDKKKYIKRRWFFFVISIPYLNIIDVAHIYIPHDMLYYLRFVPLIRGGYALAIVVGYISRNRAVSLVAQYAVILVTLIYLIALLFYYEEFGVNPGVKDFWDALYWAFMNCSTVGCSYWAVTPVGKVLTVILPTLGMLMLPLFTVFVTSTVQRYDIKRNVNPRKASELNG